MKLSIRRLRQAEEVLVMKGKAGLRARIGIQANEVAAVMEGVKAENLANEVAAVMEGSRTGAEGNKLRTVQWICKDVLL
jgi:hypothetical protein